MKHDLPFSNSLAPPGRLATPAPAAATHAGTERQGTLRELLVNLALDRRRIGRALLAGLLATALACWLAPRLYVAEASLLLRLGQEYLYLPEVGGGSAGNTPMAYDRDQTLVAEARILKSRDLHEAVVDKLGVAAIYPALARSGADPASQRANAVKQLAQGIESELLKGSNLLQVSFRHEDARTAATVLSALVDGYMDKRRALFNRSAGQAAQAEFNARRAELDKAEAELVAFKNQHGIRNFGEELSLLLTQRNALEGKLADSRLSAAQAAGRSAALGGDMATLPREVQLSSESQRSEAVDHARKLLLDLKLKERDLSAKFNDQHLAVQDVRADIARTTEYLRELEAQPQRTVRNGRSPALDAAEADLLRARAEQRQASAGSAELQAQRASIDRRLTALAAEEAELRALERSRRLAEGQFEAASKRLRDEQTLEESDRQRRSSVSLVQAPAVPLEPKSARLAILGAGLVGSLALALGVALLSALMRDTFVTPEQMQRRLNVPVLAVVPHDKPPV